MVEEKEKHKCKQCEEGKSCIKIFQNTRSIKAVIFILLGMAFLLFSHHVLSVNLSPTITGTCSIFGFCFGVTAILFFLLTYLPQRIIGNYVYYFKDKDGNVHCHTQKPIWIPALGTHCWKTAPENAVQWNAEDFKVVGSFLRIKLGGWLKRDEVLGGKGWDISSKKDKIQLGDMGFEHAHPKFDNLTPEQALDIVNSKIGIVGLINRALQSCEFESNMRQAQAVQEDLGLQMFYMLIKIRQRRDSMGRSRHAKELRKDIEQALMSIPDICQKLRNWKMLVSLVKYDDAVTVIEGLVKRYMPELADQLPEKEPQKKAANG